MSIAIGIDIGGTKIAGASYDAQGRELDQLSLPTPPTYEGFLETCRFLVERLEKKNGQAATLGVCAPSAEGAVYANMPSLTGKPVRKDLENLLSREIPFANDANCAALAEAMEGAGKGHGAVFGLILGTGVGGGFVVNGKIVTGANSLCGEIGHLPLPYYEKSDGSRIACNCGQKGCIEKLVAGAALARLHKSLSGQKMDAKEIAASARAGDKAALQTLDSYYTTLAKAMVAIIHSFDPDIITVSGGLSVLPGIYEEIPKRWGRYALAKNPKTKLVPAHFGSLSGLRGAAILGRAL